jgi:serine phosphatase RsbU (regulator of sigma subunit)
VPVVAKTGSRPSANPLDSIGRHIPFPLPVPDWSKPIILALLLVAIWFAARSRLASRRTRALERQRATLLRDLDVMQTALVPDLPSEVGGMRVSAAYRAAEGPGAGGDFYDVFSLEPGRVAVILGDVVGHGREALTDAALTRYTLRAYLQAGLDPRATLALASRVLTEPETERYVTVVVGLFDSSSGELTYATAGHPTPIILGSHEPPAITGCPALSCGLPTGRRQTRVSLESGAEVCFFSDGLIEARVPDGLFGRQRLREMLPKLGPRPLAADLLLAIRAESDACPDDMSVCIVLPRSTANRPSTYVEEFEADVRALAGGQAEHFLEACSVPPAAVEAALERASAIAVADGSALLRVDIHPAGSAVAVSGRSARARAEGEYRPAPCAPATMHPSSA